MGTNRQRAGDALREIRVERTLGMDPASEAYDFTFRADGTAEYNGTHSRGKLGRYKGRLTPQAFGRLAKFLKDRQFKWFEQSYGPLAEDVPAIITTVTGEGWSKRVDKYGSGGPPELRQIIEALERARARIRWRRISTAATRKPARTAVDHGDHVCQCGGQNEDCGLCSGSGVINPRAKDLGSNSSFGPDRCGCGKAEGSDSGDPEPVGRVSQLRSQSTGKSSTWTPESGPLSRFAASEGQA